MQLGMLFVRESEDVLIGKKCKHLDIARAFGFVVTDLAEKCCCEEWFNIT